MKVCGYPIVRHSKMNPWTGERLFVEKNLGNKEKHKRILIAKAN